MRKPTRLLAVVIALGSAPAGAEPLDAAQALSEATAEVKMREFYEHDAMTRFLTTPRRLATGAAACGNVNAKPMPYPCTPEYADELAAIRHAEMLASVALAHAARAREIAARARATRTFVAER